MGSVGFPELMVIFLVALLVLGPDKLPGAARQAGKAIAEFKRITAGFEDEIRGALILDDTGAASPPSGAADAAEPAGSASVAVDVPPPGD